MKNCPLPLLSTPAHTAKNLGVRPVQALFISRLRLNSRWFPSYEISPLKSILNSAAAVVRNLMN